MNNKILLPFLLASTLAVAGSDAWLHVNVDNTEGNKEHVRVNVPLGLAEKVLPAIQVNKMHSGKLNFSNRAGGNNVDIDPRALMDAVRNTKDGVFVTVENNRENVRVAKEGGYLVVKVTSNAGHKPENVDVRLPLDVVEALLSGNHDELDILAAIKVLATHHDGTLVSVTNRTETVRIWVDLKNSSD
jgi:CYTH domain-containing protein